MVHHATGLPAHVRDRALDHDHHVPEAVGSAYLNVTVVDPAVGGSACRWVTAVGPASWPVLLRAAHPAGVHLQVAGRASPLALQMALSWPQGHHRLLPVAADGRRRPPVWPVPWEVPASTKQPS